MKNSNKLLYANTSLLKAIWQRLIHTLTAANELQVWTQRDRYGHTYWQAYDPATNSSISLGSEAEMRIWIDQRYYRGD